MEWSQGMGAGTVGHRKCLVWKGLNMGKRCGLGGKGSTKRMEKPYINLLYNKLKYILKETEFEQRYLAWIDNGAPCSYRVFYCFY